VTLPPNAGSRSPAPSASAPRRTEPVAPPLTRTLPASSDPGARSSSSAATRRGQSHDEPRLQEDWRPRMGEEVCRAGCGHHRPLEIRPGFPSLDRLGWPVYGGQLEPRLGSTRPYAVTGHPMRIAAIRARRYALCLCASMPTCVRTYVRHGSHYPTILSAAASPVLLS